MHISSPQFRSVCAWTARLRLPIGGSNRWIGGFQARAIKLNPILGYFAQESMKFPSRILEGKIDVFVAGKGLHKPLDEKEWRYGSVSNTLNRKFCKLDFGKILAKIPC